MPSTRPLVIAHRGASVAHPENTIEAFRGALALGADAVELDARRTADGRVVVHHDAALGDGRVIVEVRAADLPSEVPTLAEALDACFGMDVNIEIKNWPNDPDFDESELVAAHVAELCEATGWGPQVLVSSFHMPTLDRIRVLDPSLETAYLHVLVDGPTGLAEAVEHGHRVVHPWDGYVTEELVAQAHEAGVRVNTWTVDDPARMAELAAWGIDGIVTNLPDVARSVVGEPGDDGGDPNGS